MKDLFKNSFGRGPYVKDSYEDSLKDSKSKKKRWFTSIGQNKC